MGKRGGKLKVERVDDGGSFDFLPPPFSSVRALASASGAVYGPVPSERTSQDDVWPTFSFYFSLSTRPAKAQGVDAVAKTSDLTRFLSAAPMALERKE